MTRQCVHRNALHWSSERDRDSALNSTEFGKCCKGIVPLSPLQDPPVALRHRPTGEERMDNLFACAYNKSTEASWEVLQKSHEICLHGASFAPTSTNCFISRGALRKFNTKRNCTLGEVSVNPDTYELWIYILKAS